MPIGKTSSTTSPQFDGNARITKADLDHAKSSWTPAQHAQFNKAREQFLAQTQITRIKRDQHDAEFDEKPLTELEVRVSAIRARIAEDQVFSATERVLYALQADKIQAQLEHARRILESSKRAQASAQARIAETENLLGSR